MADTVATGHLPARTKLLYGAGDVGNALANSAISFFLLVLLIAIPLLIWYPITRETHAEVLEKLEAMEAGA
jgi:Na+/melibiose symporter-like transporter